MGIRAIGFLSIKDMKTDIITFLNKFREGLFTLGSFGFDTWHCHMEKYMKNSAGNSNSADPEVRIIKFSDTNEVIVGYANGILISDKSFNGFLHDVGLSREKMPICSIEGSMAQLGDFKVRYGAVDYSQTQAGILFDIEYLPVNLLTADFKPLFDSVISMMTESSQAQIELILPPEEPNAEFSFKHLGELYFQIKERFITPQ